MKLTVPLLVVLAAAGCQSSSSREPWVYGLSREAYDSAPRLPTSRSSSGARCQQDAISVLLVVAAPFLIDTVLLPVTIPRDLIYLK